jgi:hypothetical protein
MFLRPHEVSQVQLVRESLLLPELAAAGMLLLSALFLWKQPDRALDTWVFAAEIAAVGLVYLGGCWALQKTSIILGTSQGSVVLVVRRWWHRKASELAHWLIAERESQGQKTLTNAPTSLPAVLWRDLRALFASTEQLREECRQNPLARVPLSRYPQFRRKVATWNLLWVLIGPVAFAVAFANWMFHAPSA